MSYITNVDTAIKQANDAVQARYRAINLDVGIKWGGNALGLFAEAGAGAYMIANSPHQVIQTLGVLGLAVLGHAIHFGLCKLAEGYNYRKLYEVGGLHTQYNKARKV